MTQREMTEIIALSLPLPRSRCRAIYRTGHLPVLVAEAVPIVSQWRAIFYVSQKLTLSVGVTYFACESFDTEGVQCSHVAP